MNNNDINAIWQPGGLLSEKISDYRFRSGQQQYAELFADKLSCGGQITIEAAAGVGKTYAYLAPLFMQSKHRAVISTASKLLQEQLLIRDAPTLMNALGVSKNVVTLKGRKNYFCPYVAEMHLTGALRSSKKTQKWIQSLLLRWRSSGSGELTRLCFKNFNEQLLPLVTASAGECLDQKCLHYYRCPFYQARNKAVDADILIINHHLLICELQAQQKAGEPLLSGDDVLVVDEAHRLVDQAEMELSESWHSAQCARWLGQFEFIAKEALADQPEIPRYYQKARQLLNALAVVEGDDLLLGLKALFVQLMKLEKALLIVEQRDLRLKPMRRRLQRQNVMLRRWISCRADPEQEHYAYSEVAGSVIRLQTLPLNTLEQINDYLDKVHCVLYTSATLDEVCSASTTDNEQQDFHRIEGPFDYRRQAMLYRPGITLNPDDAGYCQHLIEQLRDLLADNDMKFLFLVTSHAALDVYYQLLTATVKTKVFRPGSENKSYILKQFKTALSGVLLATASFWEGLDLADYDLNGVVVDRLPFDPPMQANILAREKVYKALGKNLFTDYQLPAAILRLRQACGRLIRKESDRGVLVIADPRLFTRWYGPLFIDSLPAMPIEEDINKVCAFLCETG